MGCNLSTYQKQAHPISERLEDQTTLSDAGCAEVIPSNGWKWEGFQLYVVRQFGVMGGNDCSELYMVVGKQYDDLI
mgnify:CR=1 FL=1